MDFFEKISVSFKWNEVMKLLQKKVKWLSSSPIFPLYYMVIFLGK